MEFLVNEEVIVRQVSSGVALAIAIWTPVVWIGPAVGYADEPDQSTSALESYSQLQLRFGIPVQIELYGYEEAIAKRALDAAFAEAKRLDLVFSDYDDQSEARRLASLPVGQWHNASKDLIFVSRQAKAVSQNTNGAFDVTVGPLTHLWRKTMRFKRLPEPKVLEDALARVGNDLWEVSDDGVRFDSPDMRLDFGGIAKGYALDRMAAVLREHGVEQYLIDAGGDILCGDPPPNRTSWRIEIEAPREKGSDPDPRSKPRVLELANRAVATSGATYQSVEINGVRYSHILNPQTGYGVQFLANVTVEAKTGLLADALASAVSVVGLAGVDEIRASYPDAAITITEITPSKHASTSGSH